MPVLNVIPANDPLDEDEDDAADGRRNRPPLYSLSPSPSPVPDDIDPEIDPDNVVVRGSYTDDDDDDENANDDDINTN